MMKPHENPLIRIMVCVNEKPPHKAQCLLNEGEKIVVWLKDEVKRRDLKNLIWVNRTKCLGYCDPKGTAVVIYPSGEQFSDVKFEDAPLILEKIIKKMSDKTEASELTKL
jgi:(2Fe-2S) ferredoxin